METVKTDGTGAMADYPLLFVVLVPHRDALPALETYRQSLFANGIEGAFSFPAVSPLALLKRPLDSSELKSAATELRKLMGEKKLGFSGTATGDGWVCSQPAACVRFFGPTLDIPPLSFPRDAVLQRWEKPIMAPVIIVHGDNPELSVLYQLTGLTEMPRAAALANLTLTAFPKEKKAGEIEKSGEAEFSFFERNYSFSWELGPLFWLPRQNTDLRQKLNYNRIK